MPFQNTTLFTGFAHHSPVKMKVEGHVHEKLFFEDFKILHSWHSWCNFVCTSNLWNYYQIEN